MNLQKHALENFVSMGGRVNGQAWADGEQGPPSARAEIVLVTFDVSSQ
jgi:hypothetical protein